ncbi:MAG TPA: hypothetical protein VFB58_13820 [Chloroflexota bacterium]|nr:hypothetical protein [Chloroflexota bacterium]
MDPGFAGLTSRSRTLLLSLALVLSSLLPATVGHADASSCRHVFGATMIGVPQLCVSRSQAAALARTAPFVDVDPTTQIRHDTGLTLAGIRLLRFGGQPVQRPGTSTSPYGPSPTPYGPPIVFFYRYGRPPNPNRFTQPPGARATFVDVHESIERENRGIFLIRETNGAPGPPVRTGIWTFGADLVRQHVTLEVESDGPKAVVARIGWGLVRLLRHAPIPPSPPVRVYVGAPHGTLRVGRAATFWVAMDAPILTINDGIDYAFRLSGGWSRPQTITPDGSQACGGDNVAGQPFRRHGLWHFAWGDCEELGLVLTPTRAGSHTLTIYGYRVPLNSRHAPDFARERLDARGTYTWRGSVR